MKSVTLIAVACLGSVPTMAASQSSVERGRILFNDTALGTNGKSCATCHPGGKGLDQAAAYDAETLQNVVNQCITRSLKGKSLAPGSPDLTALVSYLKTLGSH